MSGGVDNADHVSLKPGPASFLSPVQLRDYAWDASGEAGGLPTKPKVGERFQTKSECIARKEADLESTFMGELPAGCCFIVREVRAVEHDMKMVWRVRIEDPVYAWVSYKPELIEHAPEEEQVALQQPEEVLLV